ncbi:triose-phosphate isomerase [Chlamydia caviae]|uniref:Triosephosphate isomerase n=1 Tax=Chlamydia caviae (strain ATCC VR-813 / DSM 19441 / 03DC25 / GPIC) TaxID=227941 RepID=TPIS_CHLCV|nr:triose-phosphate isomerase [Chlamydia caviae]Q823U7.1 RecName: Full=Triosephosphate isomerase; Short=TIM; Short=TPI; AltName: Full=Triose-phosphate isomerase [Chlamydia caviae GPIC]AAP05057.1 triosephosphate isomerase [Chlamydia caviae GPIC]
MERKSYVFGNWKMHKTAKEAKDFLSIFCPFVKEISPASLVGIAPAFTTLSACCESIKEMDSSIWLGAQNVHQDSSGAFTGEVSLPMLQEFHVNFVLLGHSECRHIFHEEDATIALKVGAAARSGVVPVLCIGETLEARENGTTKEVLSNQLMLGLAQLPETAPVIIAYEPVWAIGTGKVASTADVQEVHAFCREVLSRIFSKEKSEIISILYGGSVKADNAEGFARCPDVDGLLVGGASLDPQGFANVLRNFNL